jgi:hypothetical protein
LNLVRYYCNTALLTALVDEALLTHLVEDYLCFLDAGLDKKFTHPELL